MKKVKVIVKYGDLPVDEFHEGFPDYFDLDACQDAALSMALEEINVEVEELE